MRAEISNLYRRLLVRTCRLLLMKGPLRLPVLNPFPIAKSPLVEFEGPKVNLTPGYCQLGSRPTWRQNGELVSVYSLRERRTCERPGTSALLRVMGAIALEYAAEVTWVMSVSSQVN